MKTTSLRLNLFLLFALCLFLIPSLSVAWQNGDVIYVDRNAHGNGSGLSWQDAFTTIQGAINSVNPGTEVSIFVAQGVYPEHNLVLQGGIKLYGSFDGDESYVEERRDVWTNDHWTVIDAERKHRVLTMGDKSEVNGFILRNGLRDYTKQENTTLDDSRGGGIYIVCDDDVVVRNNIIEDCAVFWQGGGIFIEGSCNHTPAAPLIEFNVIRSCTGYCGGGIEIAGVPEYAPGGTDAIIRHNVLRNNADGGNSELGFGLELWTEYDNQCSPRMGDFYNNIIIGFWNQRDSSIWAEDVHVWARNSTDRSFISTNWSDGEFLYEGCYRYDNPDNYNIFGSDPGFVDEANSDYHLRTGSPCIGTGRGGVNIGLFPYNGDNQPPVISNVVSSGVTSSGATITWSTNEASDSQVQYGLTTSYGFSAPLNTSMVKTHSVVLSGLSAGTTYHYRVKSKDSTGNLATSQDFTFTTAPSADTTPPVISSVTSSGVTSSAATITWSTNEVSDGQVEYGLTAGYGTSTPLNTSLLTNHAVILSGLSGSTTYHYRVRSKDVAGNSATSGDYSFMTSSQPPGGWEGYGYRRSIAIDYTKVTPCSSNLSNFPVLVSLSGTWLKTTANGGCIYNSNGYDIIFRASDGTTRLDHEIEKYDGSAGTLVAWVRVPTLSYTSNTIIYVYYGNSAITTFPSSPTGVWDSNYKGVWHLKENPSGTAPQIKDSTTNATNGTSNGSMTSGDQVAGKIGGSLDLDGTNDRIQVGTIVGNSSAFTVSAWFKTSSSSTQKIWAEGYTPSNNNPLTYLSVNEGTAGDVQFGIRNDSGSSGSITYSGGCNNNTWHYLVGVQSAKNGRELFVDGTSRGTSTFGIGPVTLNTGNIGAINRETIHHFFVGGVDEVRISNTARSACWVGTEYYNQNNPSTFYTVGNEEIYAPSDTEAPVISGITTGGITSSAATITWSTNEASDSQVEYGPTPSYGNSTPLDSSLVTTHSVTLSGLNPSTTYHFRVKSKDGAANLATSGDYSFTTIAPPDITPPAISNVTGTGITSSGATITWSTNEASDSQVEYGLTTSYGISTPLNTTLVTSHSVALSGLTASTTYHYRVKSKDAAGNPAVSGDYSLITAPPPDTQPPVISGVTGDRIGSSSATITWSTDEPADSQVEYGLTTGYGSSTALNTSLVTNHSVVLSGLSANTYHYRVKSKDAAGNLAVSGDYTFTLVPPPDTEAPVISGVTSSEVTSSGATITWLTNEASDSQVEYGLDTTYGFSTSLDSNLVTNHSVIVSGLGSHVTSRSDRRPPVGLNGGGLFHYRVKSKDAAGNLAVSGDYTFSLVPLPDTEAPVISSVASSGITSSGATITWSTNEASDSQVEYGTTTGYGNSTVLNTSMVTNHSVALSGLSAGTPYHYRVKSRDGAGNLAIGQDDTFTTALLSTHSIQLQSIQTYGNLHAGGVVATITGDANGNASAELLWRQVGEPSFRTGHPLSRIDADHFVGSLFWLRPGTNYEVQVTLSDPDGVSGSPSPATTLATRSENLPEPSTRTLYVATTGNDTNPGTNPSAPLRTIQRAATLSQPGDLILIQPGVYRESVSVTTSGTASQPIVFRGNGDGAILDGADGAIAAGVTWTSVGGGVFSHPTGFPTDHVVTEAGRLYRYNSLSDLQALEAGAPGGFYFDGIQLHVKFADFSPPASHTMQVARLEDGLVIDGVSHVRIEDLEIRNYGSGGYGKGVYLRYASDIVVRYCRIHEVERAGVWIKGGDRHRIEDNELWDTSIFTWPWSLSKGSTAENNGVRFTDELGRGHVVRGNTIHGTFNGIGIDSEVAPAPDRITNEIDVYENIIYQQMDDAFEPEGSYTSNFRFWSNQVKDVHMAFSLAPVGTGPIWVIYNVVYRHGNTPSSLTDASFLKINNGYNTPNGPIFLYHNTVFTDAPNTDAIRIMEPAQSPFIKLRNNVLSGTLYALEIDTTVTAGSVGLDMNGDDLYITDSTRLVKWLNNARYTNLGAFRTGTGQELQGLSVQPTFVNQEAGDFRLPAGSALIDAGMPIPGINDFYVGNGPDIGAYEYGLGGDTTPPVISSVASSGITSSGATITWSTDEASDSQVEYGLTISYGSSTALNTNMVTNHSVVLSELTANRTYHYRVKSKDAAGNLATGGDYTFATPAPPDTQAPTIPTGLTATAVSSTQINLSWTASTDNEGVTGYRIYRGGTEIATTAGTSYQNTGVSPSTTYTYAVAAYDTAGNVSAQSSQASATTPATPGGWDGYGYRRSITIDYTKVTPCSSHLYNFPVLVSLSGTWLKTTGNGGRIYNSSGYDIIFKASDGLTQLNHEIEKYDGSAGTLVAWVKVPTLSYTAHTTLYIYYGNSGISTDQSSPAGVWDSDFVAVWHLKEDPSGGTPQIKNSRTGNYHGTSYGIMTTSDQVAGKIGGSLDLDGTNDRIQVGSIVGNGTAFTVSVWFKTSSSATQKIWAEGKTPDNNNPLTYLSVNEGTAGDVQFGVRNDYGESGSITYSGGYNNNTWHYVAGVQNAKNVRELFVDGTSRGTNTFNIGPVTLNTGNIGAINRETIHHFFNGGVDEVRISKTARSACWIGTEYRNQNSPSAFYTVGNEE